MENMDAVGIVFLTLLPVIVLLWIKLFRWIMKTFFEQSVEQLKSAKTGSEEKEASASLFEHMNENINVDHPTSCPNCGAAITGKSANCEYCGSLIIGRK